MNIRKPTHPGVVAKLDVLEPLGLSITAAAKKKLAYSRNSSRHS